MKLPKVLNIHPPIIIVTIGIAMVITISLMRWAKHELVKTRTQNETILLAGTKHGLFFFTDSSCKGPFCQEYSDTQRNTLKLFKDRYKWSVLEIDAADNRRAAAKFNVKMVPSIVLVEKGTNEYFVASVGAIPSLDVLEQNIYRGIQQLNSQSPVMTEQDLKALSEAK